MGRILSQLPDYEIVHRLGRGAGAVISLAVERATRRQVAIKHVQRVDEESDKFIVQAENEYEIAHNLDHRFLRKYYRIVRLKKWLRTRELFLVMEYVDGTKLEEHPPERLEEILPIFIKVAEGLHAMHAAGFVHADIKPNNILILSDGDVRIIDFGQSCALGHQKTRVQGTPDFMAPEQINRHPLDHRTDIFNFGATMYWVVTGVYFDTMISTAPTAARKHEIESRQSSRPPVELRPELPLPLSKLIMECCETNPEKRPRDMRAVISRVEMALHLLEKKQAQERGAGDT